MNKTYTVYIITNRHHSTLYIGVTNDLAQRLTEHYHNRGHPKTFAGRYFCYYLLYYEDYLTAIDAISREKQLKKWSRNKKINLIKTINKELRFLNEDIMPWPPHKLFCRW